MKKIFLFIFCAGLITALHGQPINRESMQLSTFMGYPLTVGDNNDANKQIAFNKLLPIDVELDSMARFQIGAIPNQTVWHEGDITIGFYVLTDTLQATNVVLDYSIDFPPQGKIIFDEITGRFKYFPNKFDTRPFTVTFTAQSGNNIVSQDVKFTLMPATQPEYAAFGVEPVKPTPSSTDDYTIISETKKNNVPFNNNPTRTIYSYSISGKELVFDSNINNKLRYLNGRKDIEELNIFAEKVIVRDVLRFYQTNVTIYAKELVFEDKPGVIASINTSPEMWDTYTNNAGENGANAGNITLYIQDYKQTNSAFRFILVGGKGRDTNGNAVPGNGANGGKVTSTIDVSAFCDKIHGSAGASSDKTKFGTHGNNGTFIHYDKEFAWLHPNFISAVVKHAKDAYMNVYNGFTYDIFTEYSESIADFKASDEWEGTDDEQKMELTNAENEMQTVMFRITQNLDYFGNPMGWVPMLSFEINKMAFEQEIEKAIRVMYLSYWLKNIEGSNEQRINACNEAIKMVKQDLADNKEFINQLVLLIPELQDETAVLQQQIEDLIQRIENKRNELLAQAKDNVKKRNDLNKVAGVLSAVAKVAPVVGACFGPVGVAIGGAVGGAASIGSNALSKTTNASDSYGYADAIGGFVGKADTVLRINGGFNDISVALNNIDMSSLGSTYSTVKDAYNTISSTVEPLMGSIEKLYNVFSQSSTPSDQVHAELNKLLAESKEYQQLISDANVLNGKKEEVLQKLANTFNNIATTGVEVQKNIVAIDGLSRDVFNNNSKRDLRAMQYLDDMERRAKERLLKYHYYMGKSYEYRLLKPYTAELNLSSMVERFTTIAEANPNKPILDAQDFQNLKAVYEEQLSTVTATILDEYNTNRPELSVPVRFSLTAKDLEALNDDRDIILNIFERGMIPPYEENVRIVSFKIHDIKARLEGNQNPSFAYFDLLLEHSGKSMVRKEGEIYWFNHINNQNQNPVTWGIRYDARYGMTNAKEPSFASQSLLYSLLEKLGQTNNIMIYSRPGAWADIRISKNNVVSGNTKMVIDELTFELQYDFTQRPTQNRNLDVYARDIDEHSTTFMPYIEVSRADKNGRSNGRSVMYRTYNRDTDVTLTAPKEYGRYQFVNWTDRYDAVVSTDLSVNTRLTNDVALTVNYKYMGAVLKTADTIYISSDAGFTTIQVENLGVEEMEWTAVSNNSWLRITDGESGVDDGYISLEFDTNPLVSERIGSLTITTEDGEQSATVYVVQQEQSQATGIKENTLSRTKIYPNPVNDKLYIENDGTTEVLITDALGRFMYHTTIVNAGSIPIGSWNGGLYIVTLKTAKDSSVYKIVKQ